VGKLTKKMAYHNNGSFPANTKVNPKEQCKAIIIKSKKELGLSEKARNVIDELVEEEKSREKMVEKEKLKNLKKKKWKKIKRLKEREMSVAF